MRILIIFLFTTSIFCSGFTWGTSKEDKCKEANELVASQQRVNSNVLPDNLERKIIELCPKGAAEKFVHGLKYEINKQLDLALLYYDSAIKIDERLFDAYGRKGLVQYSQNNKSAAMVSLVRALEEGSKSPYYHLALAKLLNETQTYPLALYHYERARSLGLPNSAETLAEMSKAYSSMNNWKEAEVVTRQALYFSPKGTDLKVQLAQAVIRQQRLAEGIQLLKEAIAGKPDDLSLHRKLADALGASGDIDGARSELHLSGESVDAGSESLIQQGDALFLHHDFPGAIRNYKQFAKSHETAEIYQKLGDAYLAVGNDDDALGNYQKSLSISPDNAEVHYSAGVILERKGDIGKAVNEYERCLALDRNYGDAHRRLAEIYSLKGDVQKAIAEYQQIIEKAPDNPVIYFKLAKAYQKIGKLKEAKKSFELAIKLDPKNFEPQRELIKLEVKNKNLVNAEKICRGILAEDRDDQQERIRLIGILAQQKKYEALIAFLNEECIRYPNESTNYYRIGIVKEHLKESKQAIQAFLKSNEIKPSAQTYYALARIYLGVHETQKAQDALVQAKRLDPKKKEVKELMELIEDEFDHSSTTPPQKKII